MDQNLFAATWMLFASIWIVIGTQMQHSISVERRSDAEGEAVEALGVATDLRREVPRWQWRARRERQAQIEELLAADPKLLREVKRHERDVKAWNYLESAAALAFGVSVLQFLLETLD